MKTWKVVCLLVFAGLSVPVVSEAATYYVRTGGSDSHTCTQAQTDNNSNAKLTIDSAMACITTAGSIVYVHTGTYIEPGGVTVWPNVCTSNSRSTLAAYPGEEGTVTIQVSGGPVGALQIFGVNRSYITINGFVINATGTTGTGTAVWIGDGTNNIKGIHFTHNEVLNGGVTGGGNGVLNRNADDTYVAYNKIHDNGCPSCSGNGSGHNIYHAYGKSAIYEYNEVYNGANQGIQMRHQGGTSTHNTDNIIRYNYFHDNMLGGGTAQGGICIATGTNIRVHGNIVDSNGSGYGLFIDTQCVNCKVYNNSSYGNRVGLKVLDGIAGAILQNNVSLGNTINQEDNNSGDNTYTDNLIVGTATNVWVNPAAGDFSQLSTSVTVNAGTVAATYCPSPCSQGAHQVISVLSMEIGAVTTTTLVVNLAARFTPVTPATSCTGLTVRYNSAPATVNSCAKTSGSDLHIRLTMNAAPADGSVVVDASYSQTGNITDCNDIGRGSLAACAGHNQEMFAFTNTAVTNNVAAPPTFVIAQSRFRFRSASVGSEEAVASSDKEWLAEENTDVTAISPGAIAIRTKITCNTSACPDQGYSLWWADAVGGTYAKMAETCASDRVCMYVGYTLRSGDTTEQLTEDEPTYVAGSIRTTQSSTPSTNLTQDDEVEIEFIMSVKSGLTTGDKACFRVRNDAGEVITYTVTPCITIAPIQTVFR